MEQGLPYFKKFIKKYPSVKDLASALEDEVFKLWQGLGYYSRARNLHETAKIIANNLNGIFPNDYKEVLKLKGVGEYTAAAIMSFAYDKAYAVLDGNVYRVLSRVFGVFDYIDTSAGKKVFQDLAAELLDKKNPGLYNQAIMDFGALQCVPSSPLCADCPFMTRCYAYGNKEIDVLPRKKGRIKVKDRFFNYLDIRVDDSLFLRKRIGSDIWQGLYEFPLLETEGALSFEELVKTDVFADLLKGNPEKIELQAEYSAKHVLSHQRIYANFYRLKVAEFESGSFLKIRETDIVDYPVSKMIDNYLISCKD